MSTHWTSGPEFSNLVRPVSCPLVSWGIAASFPGFQEEHRSKQIYRDVTASRMPMSPSRLLAESKPDSFGIQDFCEVKKEYFGFLINQPTPIITDQHEPHIQISSSFRIAQIIHQCWKSTKFLLPCYVLYKLGKKDSV